MTVMAKKIHDLEAKLDEALARGAGNAGPKRRLVERTRVIDLGPRGLTVLMSRGTDLSMQIDELTCCCPY